MKNAKIRFRFKRLKLSGKKRKRFKTIAESSEIIYKNDRLTFKADR